MSDLPYMPFWVSKYLGKTSRLSTEQHGAYLLILFAMWQDGGQLPNNEKTLARVAGVSLRKWRSISPEIIRLLDIEGDFVTQDRLKKEHLRLLLVSQKRSASGRMGVKAKALKNKGQCSANGSANKEAKPKQRLSIPDPDPEYIDTTVTSVREENSNSDKQASHWFEALNTIISFNDFPNLAAGWASRSSQWISAWDLELDCIPTVERLIAGKPKGSIHSWTYFEAAIAEHHAKRITPVPIAEIKNEQAGGYPRKYNNDYGTVERTRSALARGRIISAIG